jgi:plastocyanin
MLSRHTLPMLALGFLLAVSASGQHHAMNHGKVDYDPEPGGGDPNPPAGCQGVQAKVTITANSTAFSPATITIDKGEPVCWTWSRASVTHNVKSDDGAFTSGPPDDAGDFQRTFDTPGTYTYHCQVHGSPISGMRGTIVVRDTGGGGGGEGPGTLEIAAATYATNEGAGALAVTVERVDGSDGAASVKYGTAPGTAKGGKDFTPRTGTLRWAAGDQSPKTFEVPVKNDTAREQDESFTVKLSKATGATIGTSTATVTIHDDDSPSCGAALTAPADLRAVGQSAGAIRLTWTEATASSVRIERRPEGGAFEEIASVPARAGRFLDSGLPGDSVFHYRIRSEGTDGLSAYSGIAAGATDGPASPCDETRGACLKGGRFEVTVEWGGSGDGAGQEAKRAALPDSPGSGLFSLASEDGPQLLLNVRDGCAVNDHYGIDFAAVTDAELTIKVRDTQTGRTWIHFNPDGNVPAPLRDVDAFATCP